LSKRLNHNDSNGIYPDNKPNITQELPDEMIKLPTTVDFNTTLDLSKYLNDKRYFMLNQWLTDYPSSKVISYADLSKIITRSKAAQIWVAKANLEYTKFNEMPDWVLNNLDVRALWKSNYKSLSMKLKFEIKQATDERQRLTEDFNKKVAQVNSRLETKYLEVARENPLVLIDRISVDALPIEKYEEILSLDADSAKKRVTQILSDYQADLATRYTKGNISLDELITILKGQSSTV